MNFKKCLATTIAITGTVTLGIHIINKIITHNSTKDHLSYDASGHYYNWRFGNIFYTKNGEGSPILLIHDINSCSSQYEWEALKSMLSTNHTVYAIDLLGCGQSSKPNIAYTSFLYVQLLNDFTNDVIKEKVDIITSGTSSSIAIMSSTNYKHIANKIILINPTDINKSSRSPSYLGKAINLFLNIPVFGTFAYNIMFRRKKIEDDFITKYISNPNNVQNNNVDIFYENAHLGGSSSKYLTASILGGYLNTNLVHALNNFEKDLYIFTNTSSEKRRKIASEYSYYLDGITIKPIGISEEYPHMENPREIADYISEII